MVKKEKKEENVKKCKTPANENVNACCDVCCSPPPCYAFPCCTSPCCPQSCCPESCCLQSCCPQSCCPQPCCPQTCCPPVCCSSPCCPNPCCIPPCCVSPCCSPCVASPCCPPSCDDNPNVDPPSPSFIDEPSTIQPIPDQPIPDQSIPDQSIPCEPNSDQPCCQTCLQYCLMPCYVPQPVTCPNPHNCYPPPGSFPPPGCYEPFCPPGCVEPCKQPSFEEPVDLVKSPCCGLCSGWETPICCPPCVNPFYNAKCNPYNYPCVPPLDETSCETCSIPVCGTIFNEYVCECDYRLPMHPPKPAYKSCNKKPPREKTPEIQLKRKKKPPPCVLCPVFYPVHYPCPVCSPYDMPCCPEGIVLTPFSCSLPFTYAKKPHIRIEDCDRKERIINELLGIEVEKNALQLKFERDAELNKMSKASIGEKASFIRKSNSSKGTNKAPKKNLNKDNNCNYVAESFIMNGKANLSRCTFSAQNCDGDDNILNEIEEVEEVVEGVTNNHNNNNNDTYQSNGIKLDMNNNNTSFDSNNENRDLKQTDVGKMMSPQFTPHFSYPCPCYWPHVTSTMPLQPMQLAQQFQPNPFTQQLQLKTNGQHPNCPLYKQQEVFDEQQQPEAGIVNKVDQQHNPQCIPTQQNQQYQRIPTQQNRQQQQPQQHIPIQQNQQQRIPTQQNQQQQRIPTQQNQQSIPTQLEQQQQMLPPPQQCLGPQQQYLIPQQALTPTSLPPQPLLSQQQPQQSFSHFPQQQQLPQQFIPPVSPNQQMPSLQQSSLPPQLSPLQQQQPIHMSQENLTYNNYDPNLFPQSGISELTVSTPNASSVNINTNAPGILNKDAAAPSSSFPSSKPSDVNADSSGASSKPSKANQSIKNCQYIDDRDYIREAKRRRYHFEGPNIGLLEHPEELDEPEPEEDPCSPCISCHPIYKWSNYRQRELSFYQKTNKFCCGSKICNNVGRFDKPIRNSICFAADGPYPPICNCDESQMCSDAPE